MGLCSLPSYPHEPPKIAIMMSRDGGFFSFLKFHFIINIYINESVTWQFQVTVMSFTLNWFCSHNVTDKKPSEKALVKKKWKLGKAHLFFGSMLESKRTCWHHMHLMCLIYTNMLGRNWSIAMENHAENPFGTGYCGCWLVCLGRMSNITETSISCCVKHWRKQKL